MGNLVTWEELIKIEPRLEKLLNKAQRYHLTAGADFCPINAWFNEGLKEELTGLVGWYGEKEEISGAAHYDIAHRKIFGALPENEEAATCQN